MYPELECNESGIENLGSYGSAVEQLVHLSYVRLDFALQVVSADSNCSILFDSIYMNHQSFITP